MLRERLRLVFCLGVALAGCYRMDDGGERGGGIDPDRPFGDTAIVVLVNPTVNQGNTTAVPDSYDPTRVQNIEVAAESNDLDVTDENGVAVLDEIDDLELDLVFDAGPELSFTVEHDGDVHDLAIAYDGATVEHFASSPVRYGVGGEIKVFDTGADPQQVAAALSTNGSIVFFRNGAYQGDLLITGDDVIFFGEGLYSRDVVIDGSVEVRGTGVRVRGFTVTGDVNVSGNDFGMAFSVVQGSAAINGNAVIFLANQFCSAVSVPSSNATILHNRGLPPMGDPPSAVCE